MLGATPLVIDKLHVLKSLTFLGVVAGAIPFLIMRTDLFDRLVVSAPGRLHGLATWHSALFKMMCGAALVAAFVLAWRAADGELRGSKTAFLLLYGLFLFHASGWVLRAPKFMLRKLADEHQGRP